MAQITAETKIAQYDAIKQRLAALVAGEDDIISLMATMANELYHRLSYVDWAGFYRVVSPNLLKVGPYQGGHGCLQIAFDRGVCGACASSGEVQLVEDVNQLPHHIACSASTQSEIVLPVYNAQQQLIAVLDLDSDQLAAFDTIDQAALTQMLADTFAHVA